LATSEQARCELVCFSRMRKVLRANTAVDCWEHEALFHEPDRVHLDDERSTVRLPRRDVHIVRESEVVFEEATLRS
jgi:hypothetical protein